MVIVEALLGGRCESGRFANRELKASLGMVPADREAWIELEASREEEGLELELELEEGMGVRLMVGRAMEAER